MVDEYTRKLEEKVANYIEATQPELEKLAEYRANDREFVKRASQSVGTLVGFGLVDKADASAMIDKLAADHTQVFGVLDDIASRVRAPSIGSGSNDNEDEKSAATPESLAMKAWTDAFSNPDA